MSSYEGRRDTALGSEGDRFAGASISPAFASIMWDSADKSVLSDSQFVFLCFYKMAQKIAGAGCPRRGDYTIPVAF